MLQLRNYHWFLHLIPKQRHIKVKSKRIKYNIPKSSKNKSKTSINNIWNAKIHWIHFNLNVCEVFMKFNFWIFYKVLSVRILIQKIPYSIMPQLNKLLSENQPINFVKFEDSCCYVTNISFSNNCPINYLKMLLPIIFSRIEKTYDYIFILKTANIRSFKMITVLKAWAFAKPMIRFRIK